MDGDGSRLFNSALPYQPPFPLTLSHSFFSPPPYPLLQELKASPSVVPLLLGQIAAYEENYFNVASLVIITLLQYTL